MSPVGKLTVVSDGDFLTGIYFEGRFLNLNSAVKRSDLRILNETEKWLDIYFSGRKPDYTPAFKLNGVSDFTKSALNKVKDIPYGKTATYGEIARQLERDLGKRVSAQSVGGAAGRNPLPIIIPCHRVTGANGKLTGYSGGLDKKAALLKTEGINYFIENKA